MRNVPKDLLRCMLIAAVLHMGVLPYATADESIRGTANVRASEPFLLHLNPGWNLKSVPLTPDEPDVKDVFADAPVLGHIWGWAGWFWRPILEIIPGEAFWVLVDGDTPIDVEISGQWDRNGQVDLQQGWNHIGAIDPIPVPTDIRSALKFWDWLAPAQNYSLLEPGESLVPGEGYAVRSADDMGVLLGLPGVYLQEGTNFTVMHEEAIVVPDQPSHLVLRYDHLIFDTTDSFINDAFEIALLDAAGNPLVHTVARGRDALFNVTEGLQPVTGANTVIDGDMVKVDLEHLPPGTAATVVFRLVNNDRDTTTSVRVLGMQVVAGGLGTPAGAVWPATVRSGGRVRDMGLLTDVTPTVVPQYGRTTYSAGGNALVADVALQNVGSGALSPSLILAVEGLSDPTVRLLNPDGMTPGGLPYVNFTESVPADGLAPGDKTGELPLQFRNPGGNRFTYSLRVLAMPNRDPEFLGTPDREAIVDHPYQYGAEAADPDGDALSFALLLGPQGMTVDPASGMVEWVPLPDDVGMHSVHLRVTDGNGGSAELGYSLAVAESVPNRPPVFESVPPVSAAVDSAYAYHPLVTDSDGDDLNFALLAGPAGMGIDPDTGAVSWLPQADQASVVAGTHDVILQASDGTATATQAYSIEVGDADGNRAPTITSTPVTQAGLASGGGTAVGNVTPARLDLDVEPGQARAETVSLTLPDNHLTPMVDVFLLLDDTGSFTAAGPQVADAFSGIVADLQATFPDVSFAFGVARFEDYLGDGAGGDQRPFTLNQPVITTDTPDFEDVLTDALGRSGPGGGTGLASLLEGLYQTATGRGYERYPNGDTTDSGPAGLLWTQLYPGLRPDGFRGSSGDVPAFSTFGDPVRYGFRLLDVSDLPVLPNGEVVEGGPHAPLEAGVYRFDGVSGQAIIYDTLNQQAGGFGYTPACLYGPNNEMIHAGSASTDFELILPLNGTYVLALENDRFGQVGDYTYSIQVPRSDPPTVMPLTLGETVSGSIAIGGEVDPYSFSLAERTLLYFDSQTETWEFTWTLEGPSGTVVDHKWFAGYDGASALNPVLDLPAGDYTLTVDATHTLTGDYAFRLATLDSATPITPGTPVSGNLAPGTTHLFSFDATAGERYFFDMVTHGDASASWRLLGPHGGALFDVFNLGDVEPTEILVDGTHTLLVERTDYEPARDGTYEFNVQPVVDGQGALTLGETTTGTLDTPGQQNHYTFSLDTDAMLYFDSLTNNVKMSWELWGPTGMLVDPRWSMKYSDHMNLPGHVATPAIKAPAGDYTLTIDGVGNEIGPYAFRLWNLADAVPIAPGTPVADALDPPGESDVFRFDAVAGDTFFFDVVSNPYVSGANPMWRLIDPYGIQRFGEDLNFVDVPAMPLMSTGAYTLLVEGWILDTAVKPYTINVEPAGYTAPPAPTGMPLAFGTTIDSDIGAAGEADVYTFSLAQPTMVYMDAMTPSPGLRWTLSGPWGEIDSETFNNPFPVGVYDLIPGDYAVTVSGHGDATGAYQFRLWELGQATPIAANTPVPGTLDPTPEADLYRFDANAGDRIVIDYQNWSGGSFQRVLVGPDGKEIMRDGNWIHRGPYDLHATGTYSFIIDGWISYTGTRTYSFSILPVQDTELPLAVGERATGAIDFHGKQAVYRLSVPQRSLLYLDNLAPHAPLHISMIGPNGTVFDDEYISDCDRILDLVSGEYEVSVFGQRSGYTGTYDFMFRPLDAATPIALDTLVEGNVDPSTGAELWAFDAGKGDRLFFDDIDCPPQTTARLDWMLVDPYGGILFDMWFPMSANFDRVPLEMPCEGSYTLLITGHHGNTGNADYSFMVRTVEGQTVPLTVGETISGAIDVAGERDTYTFTTAAELTKLYFDTFTDSYQVGWELTGPAGTVRAEDWIVASDNQALFPIMNLPQGDYRLTFDAPGEHTVPYEFRLLDLADAQPLTLGTRTTGGLDGGTDMYQFDAQAGDVYLFDAHATTGFVQWRLIDPYGDAWFKATFSVDDDPTVLLTTTGTHTLLLEGSRPTQSSSYDFTVSLVEQTPGAVPTNSMQLVLGETVNGQVLTTNQQDMYTFEGVAGQRIYFDGLDVNSWQVGIQLTSPSGQGVFRQDERDRTTTGRPYDRHFFDEEIRDTLIFELPGLEIRDTLIFELPGLVLSVV